MAGVLEFLFFVFLIYGVAPTILIRLGGIGAISRAPAGSRRIIITFDDGPDPRYTPHILDILEKYQVRACFFLVGKKARAHPELVRRIAAAGHEIGVHGYSHRPAWLLGPRATAGEIREALSAVEEVTGQKVRYCRPAWGLFNLFSPIYCRLKGVKLVLWTYMSWDWTKRATPESIIKKTLGRLRDGAILVFHDSDTTPGAAAGSPEKVVAALPTIIEGLKSRGLVIAPLKEISVSGRKKEKGGGKIGKKYRVMNLVRRVWAGADYMIRRLAGIKDLEGSSIWRVALRRYRSDDRQLPDGTIIGRGDLLLELHLNNDFLLRSTTSTTSLEGTAAKAMKEVRQSLPLLARLLKEDARYQGVKAVFAITILHRVAWRFGFTVYDLKPGILATLTQLYEKMILSIYHREGLAALKKYREEMLPKYVIMSKDELFRRYLPEEGKAGAAGAN